MRLALGILFTVIQFVGLAQQVRYEAQLANAQFEITPEILFAFMPSPESSEGKKIVSEYERPASLQAFERYNGYEAYVQYQVYNEVIRALKERFGITVSSMIEKTKGTDSTVYGFPIAGKSVFKANSGFYFLKLQVKITSLENVNMADGQPADQSTVTPIVQLSITLYDKKGKKVKKAVGKYQSPHFTEGQLEDFVLLDGQTRVRGFKAEESIRETYLLDLLKRGLGKLQENYYK